jgi:hypothetical protein
MGNGSTYILPAVYSPADATETGVWESGNTTVATVSDGVIHAVGNGSATITVKSADGGVSASCTVTVQASYNGAGITVVFEGPKDENITLNQSLGGKYNEELTVIAPSGFDRYLWYLDGWGPEQTTTAEATLYVGYLLTPGLHYFTVIVEKGGNYFSKTVTFTVGY